MQQFNGNGAVIERRIFTDGEMSKRVKFSTIGRHVAAEDSDNGGSRVHSSEEERMENL